MSNLNVDTIDTITPQETTFLGIKIDTINGPSDPRIVKALDQGYQLLDILKFIEVVDFKLNMVMFDYFWQVVVGNTPSLIGRSVLEWFGYEGEYFNQKKCFHTCISRINPT